MAWWLESATFTHFGWVRIHLKAFFQIFGAKEQKEKKGKTREKLPKFGIIDFSVEISY